MDIINKPSSPEIPFELVPLPSKGKLYPDTHPFHDCDKIEIKAPTAVEENILHSRALLKKGTVLQELIRSCLINKSVDPSSLLIGDKSALLLAIRISMFGAEYKVKVECEECRASFDHVYDLSQIVIKPLGGTPVGSGQNLFEFTLPKTGKKVLFSLLTDGDDHDISKSQENRRKHTNSEVDSFITDRLIKSIKSIDSEKDGMKLAKMVYEMPAQDSRALRIFTNKITPDVNMEQEVECRQCGNIDKQDIPLSLEFFWPTE